MSDEQEPKRGFPEGFRIEIDPEHVEETLRSIRERARNAFTAGRYTKVRISYKGKRIGPDLPLAVFLAGEGAAFFLLSPLAALLVNLGAKAVLDVEFLHESDELVQEGLEAFLKGDLEEAEQKYRQALDRRPDDPSALFNLATLKKISGEVEEALALWRRAAMGPEGHPDVIRAAEAVEKHSRPKKSL